MTEYTLVGQIINTHGVRGGVKIYPYTFDPKRYEIYNKVYIGDQKTELVISKVQYQQNIVIVYFNDLENIDEIMPFIDQYVFIPRSEEAKLEKGSYYIDDLRGLKVESPEGEDLGVLKDVLTGYGNDVYEIRYDGRSIYIPAVGEFIKSIELGDKIIIDPIKGMYDED